MRRADRLFQLVQFLRGRRLTTARWLAEQLQVSERTIYRDLRDLQLSGMPIEGEAGIGYVLRQKLDLPPMMFESQELSALRLGARMVAGWCDEELARAARSALSKINNVVPASLRQQDDAVYVPTLHDYPLADMAQIRRAIATQYAIRFDYADADGRRSQRTVWPLGLFFWGDRWTLAAWCLLRQAHRQFRLDRLSNTETLAEPFTLQHEQSLHSMLRQLGAPDQVLEEEWRSG